VSGRVLRELFLALCVRRISVDSGVVTK
jgi:hypothetical protein